MTAGPAEGNPHATTGAAVVMTTTGRVVAMASYPTYNPSIWTGGISEGQYRQLFGTGHGEPILNRVTQGEYAPGSTFKVTSTAAAVAAGYSLASTYDCPATVQHRRPLVRQRRESADLGPISLHEALVMSCDTVFYELAYEIYLRDHPKDNDVTSPKAPVQEMQKMELGWGFGKRPASTCRSRAVAPCRPGNGCTTCGRTTRTPARTGASTARRTAPTCSRSNTRTATTATCGSPARRPSPRSARAT